MQVRWIAIECAEMSGLSQERLGTTFEAVRRGCQSAKRCVGRLGGIADRGGGMVAIGWWRERR